MILLKNIKFIFLLLVVVIPFSILAQPNIEQATREVDRSVREKIEEKVVPSPEKKEAREEEPEVKPEGPTFFVKEIVLEGCESFSQEDFKEIIVKYENREVAFNEIETLAKEIEKDYLRRGVIAACFIPPQEIKSGAIKLQVIEAKMGELEITDHRFFNKQRIAYYWAVEPGEVLRYDKISRSLQHVNRNPDRQAKVTLYAGKEPQTTDILVDVDTKFPVHLTGSFDKEGTVSTGKHRKGMGVRHNNFLGIDDTLITGYSWGQSFNGKYVYHTVPISPFGTSVMYGYSYSKSLPQKDYGLDCIISRAKNSSLFLHQDMYDQDNYMGEWYLGLDIKDKNTTTRTGTSTYDRLRVLRLGSTCIVRGQKSVSSFKSEVSQGLNSFGARSRDVLSSRGAKNTFTKTIVSAQHKHSLPWDLQLSLNLENQLSFDVLTPQEEFALGGIDSVRGYPSADYLADNAVQMNAELLIPSFYIPQKIRIPWEKNSLKDNTTTLVFFDYGWGKRRGARDQENWSRNLYSVGAGIRTRIFNQALLRLEWGVPLGDDTLTEHNETRLHVSLDFEDKFIEEFKRIEELRRDESIKKWAWNILQREMSQSDSRMKNKLYTYLCFARVAYKNNRLEEARKYYQKLEKVSESFYEQTCNYIKDSYQQREKLYSYEQVAVRYFADQEYEKAKAVWEKVLEEAVVEPLVLQAYD